jgi:GNAT superfamily N-acetyltransferase
MFYMALVEIIAGYTPGALGKIVELHGVYYYREWELGLFFEAKAASEMAAFLNRFNPETDGFWVARVDGEIAGGITIDGNDANGVRLRWFILADGYRGLGLGNRLMNEALEFCRKAGHRRVYLTTFAGLDAARHLYEKNGFRLVWEEQDSHWGNPLMEQKFELAL